MSATKFERPKPIEENPIFEQLPQLAVYHLALFEMGLVELGTMENSVIARIDSEPMMLVALQNIASASGEHYQHIHEIVMDLFTWNLWNANDE